MILSIEMHCSPKFQDKMFEICEKEFRDIVYLLPSDLSSYHPARLPSPEELKGKILIKVRFSHMPQPARPIRKLAPKARSSGENTPQA